MIVTPDSKFEKGTASPASPFAFASNAGTVTGTVGANTNRGIIAFVSTLNADVTGLSVTWGGVPMTEIGTSVNASGSYFLRIFGLKGDANVATGNQTLSASWSGGTPTHMILGAVSVYNVDPTTGWQNKNSATGTSVSPTVTITSANGNMAIAALIDDNSTSATITSGTSAWNERAFEGNYNAGYLGSSSGSTAVSWTLGSSVAWVVSGVDVIAAADSAPTSFVTNRNAIPVPGPRRTQIISL